MSPLGERIEIEPGSNDIFVVDGTQRTRIFDFDGPESAWLDFATWSPGGEWVLLRYDRDEELRIVQRAGKVAGTLARDANYGPVSWWIDGVGVLPDVD